MALSIEQLRSAFAKNENTGGGNRPNNYYPFWNMKDGEQAIIRFLPDKNTDNPLDFLVEKLTHNLVINGEKKTVPCLKMYNEDCPICKLSGHYYKQEDKANGKKYWRSKQHIAQVLVVEDPLEPNKETGENHQGKVRFIQFGFQLYNVIKEAFESGDLECNPIDYENGYNFVIKKSKQGDYASYSVGSRFRPKPVSLSAEEVEYVTENLVDLRTLLPANPGLDKVEGMLNASLTGTDYSSDEAGSEEAPDDAPPAKQSKSSKPAQQEELKLEAEQPPKASEATDEFENEADKILAQIRSRRGAKA